MAIDYALVLDIINASDDPADALHAFVSQEREHAAHSVDPPCRCRCARVRP